MKLVLCSLPSGCQVGPNPALEPTRNGWSLQALISFWAFLVHPLLAAQLKRYAARLLSRPLHL